MDSESRILGAAMDMMPEAAGRPPILPVRFHRDSAGLAGIDPERGLRPAKHPGAYYLDGLTAVFEPGVSLHGKLAVDRRYSGAEVLLLNPGPNVVEILGLISRFPEIRRLHIVERDAANLGVIRLELQKEVGCRELPDFAGYVTDICHLPAELAGGYDLVVEVDVVDPKADRVFRLEAVQQIASALKLGGLFYSGGVTVRWTDGVIPLNLLRVPVRAKHFRQVGYSEALPRPLFYLKHSPDVPAPLAEEGRWRRWWSRCRRWIERPHARGEAVAAEASFVPRVEDGRGEPNTAPWDFLITKPAVRRPAVDWAPKEGDRLGPLTLGALLQLNRRTGMYVFRVRECPENVLKLMKPFVGDIPDDPLEWDRLRKSKTLKRENQALTLLKGLRFIPQRVAHGYDPATGWYAIVVEFEKSCALTTLIDQHHGQRGRREETSTEVRNALDLVLSLLKSLAIVHERGLVHQDLKPAHVFLRPDCPEAVLIDWGLARKIDEPLSEETRSISWLHAPPERADLDVRTSAGVHQDLYGVGVMLIQLASDVNLNEQPRLLHDYFLRNGRMPSAKEFEPMLRPRWKWATPVIARAISSRKQVPGYADNRFTSAAEMAAEIIRSCGDAAPTGADPDGLNNRV